MTPQEEQALVQIIVQCVRAVLDAASQEAPIPRNEASPHRAAPGSRFIDILPKQTFMRNGGQNGYPRDLASRDGDDVRESLRRFLRSSEPPSSAPVKETTRPAQSARPQQEQKRQLITQEDILAAHRQGVSSIALQPDAIVTPLARQVAKEKGIALR